MQELKHLLEEWNTAERTGNKAALRRLLASDWSATDENGAVVTREQYLADLPDSISSNENTDVRIRLYGNVAVVTELLIEHRRQSANGKMYAVRWRTTDVWVKTNGKWQDEVSQWVKVAERSTSGRPPPLLGVNLVARFL